MELNDVEEKEQLVAYYKEKNLQTINEKIKHLTKAMKIRATRCDETETQEDILAGLEDAALFGYWKALC